MNQKHCSAHTHSVYVPQRFYPKLASWWKALLAAICLWLNYKKRISAQSVAIDNYKSLAMQQWPTQHILLESFHRLRNMKSHTPSIRTISMWCSCSCVASYPQRIKTTSISGAWMSMLLASRQNVQSVTVQLVFFFPMHSSHSWWAYTRKQQKPLCPLQFLTTRNVTATVQCIIYLQSSQDAVLSASQLLTFLCWCHRPPLGNHLVS